jgi:hypothetical protein
MEVAMNLNQNPSRHELRELLTRYDDTTGNHVLWVRKTGDVELSRIARGESILTFEQNHPEMQMRCVPFQAGNEYVGPDAAQDEEWVSELLDTLLREWRSAKGQARVTQIPQF